MIKIGLEACPYCGWDEVYVSRFHSIWEGLMLLLLLRPARCGDCEERSLRPLWVETPLHPSRLAKLSKAKQKAEREAS